MDLKILETASNTENHKVVKNHTHLSKNKNLICGDEMEITLLVKNNLIEDIGYQCKSCVYCQASVSMLSNKIKNKKIKCALHGYSFNLETGWSSEEDLEHLKIYQVKREKAGIFIEMEDS